MKKLVPWLIAGLVLRLVLMVTTIHPDFRAVNLAGFLIAQKGEIFTFYDHISKLPRNHTWVKLYGDDLFIYPPVAYLTHGLFNKLLYPLYPKPLFMILLDDIGKVVGNPNLPLLLFLLKLPYLIADGLCLFVLRKILNPEKRLLGSLVWLFNPINVYTSYMVGQFDIFVALFILIALYFSKKNQLLAAASVALSAGFKPFTLLLLPLLPGSKIKNILTGLSVYLLTLLPYLASPAFKHYALLASQSDKLLFAKIPVSGSQYLSLFFMGLFLIYFLNFVKPKVIDIWGWFLAVPMLFYSVTHFHPQWLTWSSPTLVLAWVYKHQSRLPIAIFLLACLLLILLFEPSLNFGLFGSTFSLSGFIAPHYPPDQLASLARSLLAASGLSLFIGMLL